MDTEICVECGKSVKGGTGRFANRVPVLDDLEEKKIANRPHPHGEYMCVECDEMIDF